MTSLKSISGKLNQFRKASRAKDDGFLLFLWNFVMKSKNFYLTSIISVSLSSLVLCFPTNSILLLLVAKIGMSVLIQTSLAKLFFGDGNFASSPSKRSRKTFQQIKFRTPFVFTRNSIDIGFWEV